MSRNKPKTVPSARVSASDHSLLWLILILALAAVLRLYALGSIPHGFTNDEAQDGLNARQAIDTGLQVFYPENNGREGLYINLATPLVLLLGNTIWAMRLPSAIFGVLTVWMTYLLGLELFSKRIGLLGALFVATSTWHLYNSRLTNRSNAAPFFLCLALYLVFQTMRRVRDGRAYLMWAGLAGVVYGLGFHTYPSFRITPVLLLALWTYYLAHKPLEDLRKKTWLAATCFAGSAAVAIAPLALYFWKHPDMFARRASQVSVWSQSNPGWHVVRNCWAVAQMFFWRGDTDWKNNIAGQRELFLPVAILFAVGLGVAVWTIARGIPDQRRTRFAYLLLLGWLAIGAVPSILSIDEIHALRASLMIPPVFLVAAVGAGRIHAWLERNASHACRIAVAICFFVAVCWEPCQTYFRTWATDVHVAQTFDDWLIDESTEIREAPPRPTKYVVIPRPVYHTLEVPQVVLYLTRTSTEADRRQANIQYVFQKPNYQLLSRDFCAMFKSQHPWEQVFCVSRTAPLRP